MVNLLKGGAASSQYLEESMEWDLVKKGLFGNGLAIKKMGTGAELNLKIPKDPQNYELMLIAKKKDCEQVISSKSSLHTSLQN